MQIVLVVKGCYRPLSGEPVCCRLFLYLFLSLHSPRCWCLWVWCSLLLRFGFFSLVGPCWSELLTHPHFSKLPCAKFLHHLDRVFGNLPGVFVPQLSFGLHTGPLQFTTQAVCFVWMEKANARSSVLYVQRAHHSITNIQLSSIHLKFRSVQFGGQIIITAHQYILNTFSKSRTVSSEQFLRTW